MKFHGDQFLEGVTARENVQQKTNHGPVCIAAAAAVVEPSRRRRSQKSFFFTRQRETRKATPPPLPARRCRCLTAACCSRGEMMLLILKHLLVALARGICSVFPLTLRPPTLDSRDKHNCTSNGFMPLHSTATKPHSQDNKPTLTCLY